MLHYLVTVFFPSNIVTKYFNMSWIEWSCKLGETLLHACLRNILLNESLLQDTLKVFVRYLPNGVIP